MESGSNDLFTVQKVALVQIYCLSRNASLYVKDYLVEECETFFHVLQIQGEVTEGFPENRENLVEYTHTGWIRIFETEETTLHELKNAKKHL